MFLGNKSILTRGAIPGKKSIIFNDWSVSENQFNIELYNKIYTKKNVCWKKITEWIVLQYKIIIIKYLNIAII